MCWSFQVPQPNIRWEQNITLVCVEYWIWPGQSKVKILSACFQIFRLMHVTMSKYVGIFGFPCISYWFSVHLSEGFSVGSIGWTVGWWNERPQNLINKKPDHEKEESNSLWNKICQKPTTISVTWNLKKMWQILRCDSSKDHDVTHSLFW